MHVWVMQTGEPTPYIHTTARPMRTANLVHALVAEGHRVTLWCGDFVHQTHRHLYGRHTAFRPNPQVEIRLVHSRGYRRRVSLERAVDHAEVALSLRRLLAGAELPDVAFVGYPPIEWASAAVAHLSAAGVPLVVDVKDEWPEVLLRPFPPSLRPAVRPALYPYYRLGRTAMRRATALSSTSEPFLDWALDFAGRPRGADDFVLPLTAPRVDFTEAERVAAERWWDSLGVRDDGVFTASHIGAVNGSLDLPTIFAAARSTDVRFVIAGSGPEVERLRRQASGLDNLIFPGWVDRAQASVLTRRSSVAIAPYIDEGGYRLGIPNKIYDALAAGLPLVIAVPGAIEQLVTDEDVGIRFGTPGCPTLPDALARLRGDPEGLAAMSARARSLFEERFTFERVYGGLVTRLEGLAASGRPAATPIAAS